MARRAFAARFLVVLYRQDDRNRRHRGGLIFQPSRKKNPGTKAGIFFCPTSDRDRGDGDDDACDDGGGSFPSR
jgi:hypothetical protein